MFNVRCEGWNKAPQKTNEATELYVDIEDRGTVVICNNVDGITVSIHGFSGSGDAIPLGDTSNCIEVTTIDLNKLNREFKWRIRPSIAESVESLAVNEDEEEEGVVDDAPAEPDPAPADDSDDSDDADDE